VKGYIAQEKGVKINSERATRFIIREKARRKDVGRLQSGSIDLSYVNGGKATTQLDTKGEKQW
jgi:hypothetical protein